MDQMKMEEMKSPCTCGSGKMAGACCKKDETCPCGSGQKAGACCFKDEKMKM